MECMGHLSTGGRSSFQKRNENGKLPWKKRGRDLDEEDVHQIEENRHEIDTKRNTAWAIGVFKDWLMEKGISADIDNYNTDTLNKALQLFYVSVQNSSSQLFCCELQYPSSLNEPFLRKV